MASAEVTPARADWALGNPWPWLIGGVAASGAALLLARVLEADLSWFHFLLLGLGLAGTAAALCLRFRVGIDGGTIRYPRAVVLAFAGFNGLLAAGAAFLALFVLREQGFGWRAVQALFFWSLAGTWFVLAAVYFAKQQSGEVSARMEGAVLLEFAAVVPFLTAKVLDVPGRPDDWDTMRLFFAVLCLVFLVASALVAAARPLRRFVVSVLIVLHFGGIVTAVMSSPPAPWLAGYLWERLYQPYLEFMYLVNAYRFYSPEPSPATQIWFFVEYEEQLNDGQKKIHSRWLKVPDMEEDGTPRYAMRLRYQRRLALSENAAKVTAAEPIEFVDANGNPRRAEYFRRRDAQSPEPLEPRGMVGVKDPPLALKRTVPYHPTWPLLLQYTRPDFNSKQLLRSFARHVTRLPHPEHPGVKATSVKIYRVLHKTLDAATLGGQEIQQGGQGVWIPGEHPNSLTTYLPFFLGKYDPDGNLMGDDPFLYWLLPTMPERMDPTEAHPQFDVVRVYAILHAYGSEQAVEESGAKWKVRVLPNGRAADFR
jgi:hypothetical protein